MKKTVKKTRSHRKPSVSKGRRPKLSLPRIGLPRISLPRVKMPRIKMPRIKMPRLRLPSKDIQKFFGKLSSGKIIKFRLGRGKKLKDVPAKAAAAAFTVLVVSAVGWSLVKSLDMGTALKTKPHVSMKALSGYATPKRGPLGKQFIFASHLSFSDRVNFWSTYFWAKQNTNELKATVGEGPKVSDSAPLIPHKFDCTTFVETVVALSRSRTPQEFFPNLIAIRYRDGEPSFVSRNHFPELDWIPNNEHAGLLRDITPQIAESKGFEPQYESKKIDRGTWVAQRAKQENRALASTDNRSWNKVGSAKVAYIPLEEMSKVIDRIPSGAVVNIVRGNSDEYPTLITHQGFIVREKEVMFIHHAYPSGKVRKFPLKQYVKRQLQDNKSTDRPVLGYNIDQLTE